MNATVHAQVPDTATAPRSTEPSASASTSPEPGLRAEHIQDAHRDVLLAVQRGLAANWEYDQPRIAVVERGGIATVYVSTIQNQDATVRSDLRGAVRSALAPYVALAPYTKVVFLRRGMP